MPPTIELSLVSSRAMATLHAEWLQVPGPTDVLSFDYGEVVVCPWVANKEAPRHHLTTEEEVLLYGIHGLLHLGGWDDRSPEDRRAMEAEQQRLFALARGAAARADSRNSPGEH
ncbi:rRNA maturation RNase YbeY [Methylacidimicrobium sp. B4]|uniref:rRNA maturation RNase YbeY n=1 Tax=Methylacidimicrobium sp. B4 TaxID=2796139 RepID=UPI001F5C1AF7|nr:rRNA maturation RNase YbeY [Methylacidimicrobium sp. B4]